MFLVETHGRAFFVIEESRGLMFRAFYCNGVMLLVVYAIRVLYLSVVDLLDTFLPQASLLSSTCATLLYILSQ